ncbi:MAG: DUF4336 domain-containing protein [Rhodobacter sp.]|nr:DUF4336 domain-containing protein [Paracoccaceae bacterium]MCC0076174.1 DUF4336 domain-containing protein [Rhodobacter sp.]
MVLQAFGPGVWLAEGAPVVAALGFRYPLRMTVLRLGDGGLVLWSPVQPTRALRDAVADLGPVRALVAPNRLHHLFLGDWAQAFPQARLLAAPGVAQKRPDLTIAGELGDTPPDDWADAIDTRLIPNTIAPEVLLFHRESGTALVCDLLQNMAADWYHGWRAVVARLDRMTEPTPTMPRKFRLAARGVAARAALRAVMDWPAERVVVAHGTPVAQGGRAFLRQAFGAMASLD